MNFLFEETFLTHFIFVIFYFFLFSFGQGKTMFCSTEEMENEEPMKTDDDFLVYTDPKHGSEFLEKLYDLYTRSQLCNVKLQVGDEVLHAHKVVLASSSRYFEGEFTFLYTEFILSS